MENKIEPRECVKWFSIEMEKKLLLNDHKTGWNQESLGYLFVKLMRETSELSSVLSNLTYTYGEFDSKDQASKVIKEAADVANYAMMIADRARKFL